jgi:hypothetical protein
MRASNLNIMTFTCAVVFGAAAPWVAHAAEVGNIEVCYNCGSGSDAGRARWSDL